jgi:cell division protein FtsI (penicillin-binding protein 3)
VRKEKLPARRVRVLVVIMAIWSMGIAARLYFLQIVESKYYVEKAAQHQQDEVPVTPRRGDIWDRNGNLLASSSAVDSVFARPSAMKDPATVARALAPLTGLPFKDLLLKLDPDRSWVFIKRKITPEQRRRIEKANLPGVGFQPEFKRFYPKIQTAAHLLGYVDVDEVGKSGLEASYNSLIGGQPGKMLLLRDGLFNTYQREQQLPLAGANLTTTIDMNIQFFAEKELIAVVNQTHAAGASIVVMDPNSGAILADANWPTYNPNNYQIFPEPSWSQNPSLSSIYEPGSTFKMVTVAAALEEGLTTPDEKIFCENGAFTLHGRTIDDHDKYGWLTVREIIQNSSNIGAIKLGIRVGEERLWSYIDRYGFGKKTSIDLPAEVTGQVHDVPHWQKTSIASVSMGHEVSVTPLQTAMMVSIVANGGIRYKPYVVQKIDDPRRGITEIKPSGVRVMSQKTAQQLREMLEDVVTDGTAKTSRLEGYRAAGKTGTAQKVDTVNGGYFKSKYVSSFAGFVPVSNPKLAIVVVIDDPKGQHFGGVIAAPVFKRIAEQALRAMSVVPDVPDYAPRYTVTPERSKQQPAPPSGIKKSDFKVLDASLTSPQGGGPGFEPGEIVVPDYTGKSSRQAVDESGKLGLEPRSSGFGRVVGQYPPPGTPVRPGTRIRFTLSLQR